jgi:uncharacterized membrane protein YhaH (DUF805 family)
MNFVDAVKKCFMKFADFNGRAGLPEYWWFTLFGFAGAIIIGFVSSTLSNLFSLVLFIPSIAVTARRLHDTNKSGWLQLAWIIGSAVGIGVMIYGFFSLFFGGSGGGSVIIGIVGILICLASFVFMVICLIKSGDAGENQYGPVPEESTSLTA